MVVNKRLRAAAAADPAAWDKQALLGAAWAMLAALVLILKVAP